MNNQNDLQIYVAIILAGVIRNSSDLEHQQNENKVVNGFTRIGEEHSNLEED